MRKCREVRTGIPVEWRRNIQMRFCHRLVPGRRGKRELA